MTGVLTVVLVAATLTTGLVAGLFYGWSCSVMPGLRRVSDRTFVDTMQRVNVAILNGWFLLGYVGSVVLIALAGILDLFEDDRAPLPWIAAAFVLYVATLGITAAVNIPLNNELDAAGDPGRIADLAAVRARFEDRWVRWNLVRTVTSVLAFGCLTVALVYLGRAM